MSRLKIAFYGGSFDPPHLGHMAVAQGLLRQFELDEFVFVPAFHAPHKKRADPTSPFDRYAMLCLVTENERRISVSKIEVEQPAKPYTVETLLRLKTWLPDAQIFFVMGADSWSQIRTWREWESVLTVTDQIVVTRPGFSLSVDHVTRDIRERIIDLQEGRSAPADDGKQHIYFSDAAEVDISATAIRHMIREGDETWREQVPKQVANYIEKYNIYT
jgi:nicotinate-nucleotide adenylyltransferase